LRVDFYFLPESRLDGVLEELTCPVSVESMVVYDGSGGRLSELVATLVGRRDRPADPAATFTAECGDFWYFLLYVHSKLQRGERWVARTVFHSEVLGCLLHLLRLEAGALDRWQGSGAGYNVERTLSPERLARLDACVPAPGSDGLRAALLETACFGAEVSRAVAPRYGVPWPQALAKRVVAVLRSAMTAP
jgi:Streptomycin adenylyltransferase